MKYYEIRKNKYSDKIVFSRREYKHTLKYYLSLIDKDFIIIKFSGKFRILTLEELLEETYCAYMFYYGNIDLLKYNIEIFNKLNITFLHKIVQIKYLKKIVIR